jgi:putative transposase
MLLRNYEFRLYPSPAHRRTLELFMLLCCRLYNCALEQRISAYKNRGKSFRQYAQANELPALKLEFPEYAGIPSHTLQNVLARLHKAFQNFFRRLRQGAEKPGFPRFKPSDRYNTLVFLPQAFKFFPETGHLRLTKVGELKLKQWKELPEGTQVKRVTVKKVASKWYAVFCCELPEPVALPYAGKAIGLDLGLKALVTDSDGQSYGDLRALKQQELCVRKRQEVVSRRKKGSMRRKRARALLAQAHDRLRRRRSAMLHQISQKLIREHDLIALEDLQIRELLEKPKKVKNADSKKADGPGQTEKSARGLRRNIQLAAWGELVRQVLYKAEEAGRAAVLVNPKGTTQECSSCGTVVKKDLSVRVHQCSECGLVLDRDHNAAINILNRALQAPRVNRAIGFREVCLGPPESYALLVGA